MEYLNLDRLEKSIETNKEYSAMIEAIKDDVNQFCSKFNDDPQKISRWGHHYFCQKDGGLLIYNRETPSLHVCEICGHPYENQLLDGVWVYMYRNEAIINAWKSAFLFRITKEKKYLDFVRRIIGFYSDHYLEFKLHNKEGLEFNSLDEMIWGCGRIMPQGLNESILLIRVINALELVKDHIGNDFLKNTYNNLFKEAFKLLKPQVDSIHNISCWVNSAIGTMGLFMDDKEMVEFAFMDEFNIRKQLQEGVTKDGFWYEGSIHYNFFTLEGVTNLLLFSKLYGFEFGVEKNIIEKMFRVAYEYAFDNHQLPNPNDGWPNLNLKSYSYIYCMATKVFGVNSEIGNLLKNILNTNFTRGEFPLSKPYYYKNGISLERLILIPELDPMEAREIKKTSVNFETSYCGILKNDNLNIFYKYGHNGPSHAHPDKMNIEVVIGDYSLSRDLSNSGYGNRLCNEWHRMSASHNTVLVNGTNHTSMGPGKCLEFNERVLDAIVEDVYGGVNFRRRIEMIDNGFIDNFEVTSDNTNIYDFFFHVEAELLSAVETEDSSLTFNDNGYQHIKNVKKVIGNQSFIQLEWKLGKYIVSTTIDLIDKLLFIANSPDNPITKQRNTIILQGKGKAVSYKLTWTIKEGV